MVLTLIHHAYGALIYEESFRLHAAYFAIPVILVLMGSYRIYRRHTSQTSGNIAFWIFIVIVAIVPIGMIGLFEGGYNHLLKNILYFGGISHAVLDQLFPPPMYEMPNDILFEATGILQFFLGVYAAYCFVEFGKGKWAKR